MASKTQHSAVSRLRRADFFLVESPLLFDSAAELGMGFHYARSLGPAGSTNESDFIVFNGTVAISAAGLYMGGLRSKDLNSDSAQRIDVAPCDDVERFLEIFEVSNPVAIRMRDKKRVHGSPPHPGVAGAMDHFVRFSITPKDRRVQPGGWLLAGSYATSLSDAGMVPNAMAAIGRYALPSSLPPQYRFDIVPMTATNILFGTVAPLFGQAGGGAEVEFTVPTMPGSVLGPSKLSVL